MVTRNAPLCGRDFQRIAEQRLTTAEFLGQHGYNLHAFYLAGYAIECSLKTLIIESSPGVDQQTVLEKNYLGRKNA